MGRSKSFPMKNVGLMQMVWGGGGAHNEHSVKESQKHLKIRTRELRGVLSFTAILIERALCHFVRRKVELLESLEHQRHGVPFLYSVTKALSTKTGRSEWHQSVSVSKLLFNSKDFATPSHAPMHTKAFIKSERRKVKAADCVIKKCIY